MTPTSQGALTFLSVALCLVNGGHPLPVVDPLGDSGSYFYECTARNTSNSITTAQPPNDENGGVHLVSWNFDYVAEPLIISVFILVAGLLKLVFHYAHFLSSVIPESWYGVLWLVFSLLLCLLILAGTAFDAILYACGLDDSFSLDSKTFMLYLLPPIILDSAYSLHDRVFFENIGTILLYAVVGTILSFLMLGPTLWGLYVGNAMGEIKVDGEAYEFGLVDSFLFSSFIVAVDPVAVLAIFEEVGVNSVLYFLVFGESLLNDAVTVVLSNMMKAFVKMDTVPTEQIWLGVCSFFTISLGGLAIGLVFGILTGLLTRATKHARVVEPVGVLIMAYLSYICAELFHWSGIISMIGCGLLQAKYSFHNISRKSYVTVKYFTKMLSAVMDALIFMLLGMELVSSNHHWHTGFTLWAMFYCLIYRLLTVFGLTLLANFFRAKKVGLEEQITMWYGGLRGAVCFALCDTIHEEYELRHMMLTTTLFVILFTVFIQGTTIKPLVKLFKVRKKDKGELTMNEVVNKRLVDHTMTGIECIIHQVGENRFRAWCVRMDERYLSNWLQTNPLTHDQRILEAYGKMALNKWYRISDEREDVPLLEDVTDSATEFHTRSIRQREEATEESPGTKPKLRLRRKGRKGKRAGESPVTTADELSVLFEQSRPPALAMQMKYDPNLLHDDELDLTTHLQEHHKRVTRLKAFRIHCASMEQEAEIQAGPSRRATIAGAQSASNGSTEAVEMRSSIQKQWKRATVTTGAITNERHAVEMTGNTPSGSVETAVYPRLHDERWQQLALLKRPSTSDTEV